MPSNVDPRDARGLAALEPLNGATHAHPMWISFLVSSSEGFEGGFPGTSFSHGSMYPTFSQEARDRTGHAGLALHANIDRTDRFLQIAGVAAPRLDRAKWPFLSCCAFLCLAARDRIDRAVGFAEKKNPKKTAIVLI